MLKLVAFHHPHDNAIVVIMQVASHRVFHMLVNNYSFVDVLYVSVYNEIGSSYAKLKPSETPFLCFDRLFLLGA